LILLKTMIKFSVKTGKSTIAFQFCHEEINNWIVTIGDSVWQYSLDFTQTLNLLASNKMIWCKALFCLINQPGRLGLHLPKNYRIVGQMYLNWFGLPATKDDLQANPDFPKFLSCEKHQVSPEIPQCLSCGLFVPNVEDDEEEEEADLCECGFPEAECECPGCDFCGEKEKDCRCLICENEDCARCKCKDKNHLRKHKLADCHCEPPCNPKEKKKKHERLRCECESKLCDGCGLLPENCDCPESSSSCEYEY
jgi:hypothetical protein